jgi:hypothetical protein
MSKTQSGNKDFTSKSHSDIDSNTGLCILCRHKMTLFGIPFTAEITCSKRKTINHFIDFNQPVQATFVDFCV